MTRAAVLATALGSLLVAATPAYGQTTFGHDVTCALGADVRVDRAAGTFALNGVASPCDIVTIGDDLPRAERAVVTGSGTVAGDPCASASWTGLLGAKFRWRGLYPDIPVAGSSTGPLLMLDGVSGFRRVTATLTLTPRSGTCAGDSFLALGRMTYQYRSTLPQLP